ncbi:Low-density receptor-like protein [Quillaja saponaria]|uniref:Low-density receptor-like protein n=1 Tax=Quillaja saponaria TaxID=32244 RepID=A0AAD7VP23_QUISA|nr:Low-density receptor-like protein [Quillaja saponaria]
MATCFAPLSISGPLKTRDVWYPKPNSFGIAPKLTVQRKSNLVGRNRKLSVCAEYGESGRGGGGDFVAGFLLGGAIFGTVAYIFAPQIRRSILNEDEYGFRKAKRPVYYDEGLETRHTLNEKISQLNSAIDNVSSRLRGGNNVPAAQIESDPELEATL